MRFGGIRNGFNERRFKKHLAYDENSSIDPFIFAKLHSGYLLQPSPRNRHIQIIGGSVSSYFLDQDKKKPTQLQVDIALRVDHRNTPKERGSYVHSIALKIDLSDELKPEIAFVSGIVTRQGAKASSKGLLPKSLHSINADTLDRDLMFLRQSLLDRKDFMAALNEKTRNAIVSSIERFVSGRSALLFPQILPSVKTPARSAIQR